MAQVVKRLLTGSTNGRPILQAATASPGTLIHTAATTVTTAGMVDEIWLWAQNATAAQVTLIIEFGGTTGTDAFTINLNPLVGPQLVVPGLCLNGGVIVRAYCAAGASRATLFGFVNQSLTP